MNPSNISTSHLYESQTDGGFSSSTGGGLLSTAKGKIKGTAQDTAQKIKASATETAARLRERAAEMAGKRKEDVAERLEGIGHAVHDSAKNLEEKDPNIAWLTHRTAERLESAAAYVRSRDWSELRADAEDVARRHPLAFLGGLFVAGLVVGNLVKATRPAALDWEEEDLAIDSSDALSASAIYEGTGSSSPSDEPAI